MRREILGLVILITAMWTQESYACSTSQGAWKPHVESLQLTARKYTNMKNPLLPDIDGPDWGHHVEIGPCVSFMKRAYLDSQWYFDSAYKKVMEVGLHYTLGVRVADWLDVTYVHHSYHSADRLNVYGRENQYGLADSFGFQINFITGGK